MRLLLIAFTAFAFQAATIFGDDDRKDLHETSPQLRALAASTAAIIDKDEIKIRGGVAKLKTHPYGRHTGLCRGEKFYDQQAIGDCSGTLIGSDVLLTAGHCIKTAKNCAESRFVFERTGTEVPATEVYKCARVIKSVDRRGEDWALIQLDRRVDNRSPVALDAGPVALGQRLAMIGYPRGLPAKVNQGAVMDVTQPNHFQTNLTIFSANSGSGVFNVATGKLVGIAASGGHDFYKTPQGCYASVRCPTGGTSASACLLTDVTRLSVVQLPAFIHGTASGRLAALVDEGLEFPH